MSVREILAGRAVVELGLRNKLEAGLRAAQQRLTAFGGSLRTIGTGLGVGGAALTGFATAAISPLVAAAKSFSDFGDSIQKMAIRTGISTEALSELSHAAGASGTSLASVEKGISRMQRTITDATNGMQGAKDTIKTLGLNLEQLSALSPEDQFTAVGAAIAAIEDPTLRAGMAMQIFGRSGAELIPLLTDDIGKLRAEARELGLTLSNDDANAAAALNDAFGRLSGTASAAWLKIGAAIAPAFTAGIDVVTKVVSAVTNWIDKNRSLFVALASVAAIVATLGVALTTAGLTLFAMGTAIAALAPLLSVAFSPLGAGVALLLAAAGAAYYFRDALAKFLAPLAPTFTALGSMVSNFGAIFGQTFGGIVATLASGNLAAAGSIAMAGLTAAFWQGAADLGAVAGSILDMLTAWIPGLDSVREYAAATFASIGQSILAGRWDLAASIAWAKIKLVVTQGWAAIHSIFIIGKTAIGFVWDGFVNALTTTWRAAYFGIAQGFVWIANQALSILKSLVPAIRALGFESMANSINSLSVDGVSDTLKQMQDEAAARDKRAADARRKAREDEMARAYAADAAAVQSAKDRVAALEAEADAAHSAAGAPTLSDKAAAARQQLDDAIQNPPAVDPAKLEELKRATAGGQAATRQLASTGTFSAAAAAVMGTGSKPMEQTARNTAALLTVAKKQLKQKPTQPAFGA